METQEIDIQLDELENRLDRLRSLYEQYFIGIEKLEPSVPRKDVDRRFWMLRKLHIRNTARRFRLQVLVQRYNTFQQYWTRICREIENGTYVRHLLKAQKNLGAEPKSWAAKKRLGLLRAGTEDGNAGEENKDRGAADLGALLESDGDLNAEADRAAGAALESVERAAAVRAAAPPPKREDLGPLDLDFDDEPAPSVPRRPPAPAQGPNSSPVPSIRMDQPVSARPSSSVDPGASMPPSRAGYATPRTAAAPPSVPAEQRETGAAKQAPVSARAPNATGAVMTDERVRQLHAELIATRRQQNQAHNVPLETFAKSIRDTETKLLAQHRGGSVEFHVVVKDGKTIVKPVVRK